MNKQIKYGSLIAYLNNDINLVINFALTTFMLSHLCYSEYGVYKIVQSFTGQLAIMSFGLGTVATRYVVLYNTQKKKKDKENFLFLIYMIAALLGFGVIVIGAILYGCMDVIYAKSLTSSELYFILVINVAFSILCDAFFGIIRAHERFVVSNILSTFRLVLRLLAIIILLNLGVKSIGIVITDLSITILILLFSVIYVKFKLKEKAKYNKIDKKLIVEIETYA